MRYIMTKEDSSYIFGQSYDYEPGNLDIENEKKCRQGIEKKKMLIRLQ